MFNYTYFLKFDIAGTMMPTSVVDTYHCRTHAPGWLNGTHPTSTAQSVDVGFCFDGLDGFCNWSTRGKITNCGDFFVYYLENTRTCALRYCATN